MSAHYYKARVLRVSQTSSSTTITTGLFKRHTKTTHDTHCLLLVEVLTGLHPGTHKQLEARATIQPNVLQVCVGDTITFTRRTEFGDRQFADLQIQTV